MLNRPQTHALVFSLACSVLVAPLQAQPQKAPGERAATQPAAPNAELPPCGAPSEIAGSTAAQREQLMLLRRQAERELAPQREQLRARRLELRTLWSAESPSKSAIVKKWAQIDALRAAMRPTLVKHRLAQMALLTPEQRQALWCPATNHDCCARHMGERPHREVAGPRGEPSPWLSDDDIELDGEEMFPGTMECPSPPHGMSRSMHEPR